MNKITRYTQNIEVRAVDTESRTVAGIPIVFNQITDLGWFTEEIDRHALDQADLSDVILNFNHNDDVLLARTTNGSLNLDIRDTDVYMTGNIIDTTQGDDALKLVKSGLVNAMSFAFIIDDDGERWEHTADGREHRVITKIKKLFDTSLVVFPAYPQTSAWARGNTDELAEKHKALMQKRYEQDRKMEEILNGKNLIKCDGD